MYNIWNAVAYEITRIIVEHNKTMGTNPWIKQICFHCFPDWVIWKTERTMKSVDKQINEIRFQLDKTYEEEYIKPITIEYEPDLSRAQQLLGGEQYIKAPWLDHGDKN